MREKKTIRQLDFMAPIKTVSEANGREHWAVKNARKLNQQTAVMVWMGNALKGRQIALPCVVKITRIGPRKLDSDNLLSSMKGIRDEIARILKVDDGDESKVRFDYDQMPVGIRDYGVKVKIVSDNGE